MTTLDGNLLALAALVDAGEDLHDQVLLGVWADALEEAGDARAAGLRRVGDRRPSSCIWIGGRPRHYYWEELRWDDEPRPYRLPEDLFALLRQGDGDRAPYPTRSAAFLALALALAP